MSLAEIVVGELEGKIVSGELDFEIAFIPSPRPEFEYHELGAVKFSSFVRADMLQHTAIAELLYVVPTSDFPFNPLRYNNRDGWPKEVQRKPYFFSVSGFAIELNLLCEGQGVIYMPDFVAQHENAHPTRAKIVKVKEYDDTSSPRVKSSGYKF